MHKLLLALVLLASCSSGGGAGANHSEEPRKTAPERGTRATVPESLVGLFEGGQSGAVNQLCIVERGGESRFGLLLWGDNDHSCSGSGTVERESGRIYLAMAGDSPCRMEARFEGGQLRLADEQPAGCAYYCGARARMAGARLTQSGQTESDALR